MDTQFILTDDTLNAIKVVLSDARIKPYILAANNDLGKAIRIYEINIQLCEALYPSLHTVEVALRNAIDKSLSYTYEKDWLWNQKLRFDSQEKNLIQKSTDDIKYDIKQKYKDNSRLQQNIKSELNNSAIKDKVIAELNFGFWKALIVEKYYQTSIFNRCSKHIFRHAQGNERDVKFVRDIIPKTNLFRNRVFHHEPIWNDRELLSKYKEVYRLINWICPKTATWINCSDRFMEVYKNATESIKEIKK